MENAINYGENNCIYICSGNYYTEKYITIDEIILNDFRNNNFSRLLFNRISKEVKNIEEYIFISVTSMNNKILKSMIDQNLIDQDKSIFLENYHYKLKDFKDQKPLKSNSKYILVCELIATGFLTNKINHELKTDYNSSLEYVAVYINTLGDGEMDLLVNELKEKIIYLKKDEINKHDIKKLSELELKQDIVRINPFTNQPIHKSLKKTNISESIILHPDVFFDGIDEDKFKIKYLDFYGSIQSYFFDLESILIENGNLILEKIFNKINTDIKSNIDVIFYPKNSSAAFIDFDYLTDKILLNHSIPYFELERFETNEGFKFPHLSTFYENISFRKKILIIDDSSNSGNSIQQLIDEIIFFDVKEIVVLVLLSRISDEKLEFLSRIKKIKGDKSEIKISILYGCHINIPTYKADNNPNNLEINWLKQLRSIQNVPSKIYTISQKISKEISAIPILDFDLDYKYLPWKGKNKLSKKTLAKTRNEVGKILGHRFYIENFKYFNDIIILKKDFLNPQYTKRIEELVSVFIYEPFLYNPFKKILPDIVAILEELIEFILFSKDINKSKILYYHWDKQDLVHLFFIIFNDKELIDKISISENFEKIINFCGSNNLMALNYIFYKLLKYVPIDRTETEMKIYSGDVKLLLEKNVQANSEQFNQTILREIKYFKSFLSTLPSDKKFNSLLSKVAGNYGKLTDDKEHSHAIKALYDKFRMKLIILKNKYYTELAEELYSDWENISVFINDILELSSSFPNFFMIHYNRIEGNSENSLRNLWSYFSENIKNINSQSDLLLIEKKLDWFKLFFLDKNVVKEDQLNRFYNVFSQITTPNIIDLIESEIAKYNDTILSSNSTSKKLDYSLTTNFKKKVKIDFPYVYFKELILSELIKNLEHRDNKHLVNIDVSLKDRLITIKIENKKKKIENRIGGNGIRLISKLNNYPNQFVTYKNNSSDEIDKYFIQVLTFEIT